VVGASGQWEVLVVAEAIEKIRSGEVEAEEIERAARAEHKATVAAAHDEAERLIEETRKAAREEERALKAKAAKEAEAEAETLVAESRAGVAGVKASAEQRVEDGIRTVLNLVIAGAVRTRG
jgi:vacuolar-type H+-ATPase subunit H